MNLLSKKTFNTKYIEYEWSKYWLHKILQNVDDADELLSNCDDPYDFRINWHKISKSSNIYWVFIEKHMNDYPWDHFGLSFNKNITWDNIKNNPQINWSYFFLSSHPNITLDIMISNPLLNWCPRLAVINPNITLKMIQKYSDYFSDISLISKNPNISINDVLENIDTIDWNFSDLCYSKKISWNDINKYSQYFDKECFSSNPNLTYNIVYRNPHVDWDYNNICKNSNISWNIIRNNPNKFDENCILINLNPNITFDIIERYPYVEWEWNWGLIVLNDMTYERHNFFLKKIQKYYIKNIYDELRIYVNIYRPRKSYLMLLEGCPEANGHIVKYLFDEMIRREICSLIYL